MMKINVKTSNSNYDIIIENGAFSDIASHIHDLTDNKKVFVVTDDNVDRLYGEALCNMLSEYELSYLVLPHGETTKSSEYLNKIYSAMASFGMSRTDILIAFGGGVIGDLAGFAASTFLRGIDFIQVPTTLLSQVDSSVGGKVAIDLPEGKNLVGSFYPPARVIIDPDMLSTLPERVFSDGMAEVIKYGVIRDKELFNHLFGDIDIGWVIQRCVNIKKTVVQNDEFDTGERMILNFGHTFGHVVEKLTGYTLYTHGEAVAIGMLRITEKSEAMGITKKGTASKLKELLSKYNLVFDGFTFSPDKAREVLTLDKKSTRDYISYIMVTEIGEVIINKLPKDDTFLTEE